MRLLPSQKDARSAACAAALQDTAGPHDYAPARWDDLSDTFHFWSRHRGGCNFAVADGSVRFLSYSASSVLPALATRASGEAVAFPE